MNKYGLTEREKEIWPPTKKDMPWDVFIVSLALIVLMFIAGYLIHKMEPVIPTAHAAELYDAPDSVQTREFCKSWNKGTSKVTNADNMTTAAHCEKYL